MCSLASGAAEPTVGTPAVGASRRCCITLSARDLNEDPISCKDPTICCNRKALDVSSAAAAVTAVGGILGGAVVCSGYVRAVVDGNGADTDSAGGALLCSEVAACDNAVNEDSISLADVLALGAAAFRVAGAFFFLALLGGSF